MTWNHIQLAFYGLAALIVVAWIVAVIRTERPQPFRGEHKEGR
ncbi:hypothetical protein ACFRCW_36145 [Streptomyces sp. NPDC056653]|nr:hypothetical protein OG781_18175 [Streptomyces sp. NBC_00830]